MATVIRQGKVKAVKNLGWLLCHWKEIESLGFNYLPHKMNDGELVAKLKDGGVYITTYANLFACWNWLLRPVFHGLTFRVCQPDTTYNRTFTIADNEFRRLNRLPYAEFSRELGLRD